MNNVVDRVPTQVLSNGAIRWEQFDSNGNSLGYVYMKRADEPTQAGTPLNKVLFDSIKTDLTNLSNNKLNVSAKATQAQAETGTDNTNYMTALRVKQALNVNKVTINNINLSESSNNTIDLTQYINSNTIALEIPVNIRFKSSFTSFSLNGNKIYKDVVGIPTSGGSSNVNISGYGYIYGANLIIKIYPGSQSIHINGLISIASSSSGGTQTDENISEIYSYDSISSLFLGKLNSSMSSEKPISIISYIK